MDTSQKTKSELGHPEELQIKEIPVSDQPVSEAELRQIQKEQTEHKSLLSDPGFKGGSQAVLIVDADQRIQSVNAEFEAITGYSQSEMLGQPWESFRGVITESQFVAINRYLAEVRNSRQHTSDLLLEFHSRRKDGSEYWTDLSISPIRNTKGELTQLVVVMRDITTRMQSEKEYELRDQRLAFAVKAANMGLFDWHFPTNTTFFSREWKSQIGYAEDEIQNRYEEWESRLHPDDRHVVIERLEKYLAGKLDVYDVVFRMRHKDGSWKWVNAHGEVVCDKDGNQTRMIGCHIDINEQKLAAESLELMKFCVDSTADPVYWISRQGRILYVNKACTVQLGYSRDELLTMSIWDLDVLPDYQPDLWERHFDAIKEHGNIKLETCHRTKDGRVFPVDVSANYVKIGDQELNFAFSRDISGRKQSEDERHRIQEQMLQAHKLEGLGVMASGIAHDFNNLLTAMLGNASLARMELPENSPVDSYLDEIESAARSAARLTSQMLAYSGKGRFVIQPMRLDTVINETIHLTKAVISNNIDVVLDLKPASIAGDAAQCQQIIINLIANASDSFKGEPGQIRVRTGVRTVDAANMYSSYIPDQLPGGKYAFLEVTDGGCGMSKETLDKIFDPFFSTKMTGRGLGLAAVLGIIRSHKGTIKVTSELGKGTSVEVLLPAIEEPASNEISQEIDEPDSSGEGTILLVDDEDFVRNFLSKCIQSAGFNVLTASDGCQGLEVFHQNASKISVVLLDLTMPRKSGLDVLKELRSHSVKTPVLMMSGYSEQDVSAQASGIGACAFIQKPFSPDELMSSIYSLIASRN